MIKRKSKKLRNAVIIVIFLVAVGIAVVYFGKDTINEASHPLKYTDLIEKFSSEFNVDKYLVYAIIKTESNFKADAVSNVGAVGLMQIMNDTFDFIKFKLKDDENIVYDDMFIANNNIRYGCYLLGYLDRYYGDFKCAIAAYHAGVGNVDKWLTNAEYSADGKTLTKIPIDDTEHYVNKVTKAFKMYKHLYDDK